LTPDATILLQCFYFCAKVLIQKAEENSNTMGTTVGKKERREIRETTPHESNTECSWSFEQEL
jgi:hypothetical protein